MIDPEPFENSLLFKQDGWARFIQSVEWQEFQELLLARKAYLEKQVIIYVKNKNWEEAAKCQAKAEEDGFITNMAHNQLKSIEKEIRDGDASRGT